MDDTLSQRYAPPRAEVRDTVAGVAAPALWNPSAAFAWSLVFTPVFGALLHMKNWRALGEPARAAAAARWAKASLLVMVGLTVASEWVDDRTVDAFTRLAGLGLLVAWYVGDARGQAGYVAARYGKRYPRRGWAQPIAFGLLATIGFFAVAVAIGVVVGLVLR